MDLVHDEGTGTMSVVGSGWLERLLGANPQALPKICIKNKSVKEKCLPGRRGKSKKVKSR